MALIIEIRINERVIERFAAINQDGREHDWNEYIVRRYTGNGVWADHGKVVHHRDNGAVVLSKMILERVLEEYNGTTEK